jgi:3-phenylpropionate/cinnamic acid dioxygenase small subunit
MSDRGEIENLLYEYQARLDAGDLEAMAALFEHAVMSADTIDQTWRGSSEVLELFRQIFRIYADGSPHTTHTTLNPIICVNEDAGTATCRSVYVVYQQVDDFPLQPIITGGYHDTFERVDGAWRFASRTFVAGLQGDLRAHQVLEDHPVFDKDSPPVS